MRTLVCFEDESMPLGPADHSIATEMRQFEEDQKSMFQRYSHRKDAAAVVELLQDFTREGALNREARCLWLGFCTVPGFLCYSQHILSERLRLKKSSIDSLFIKQGYASSRRRSEFLSLLRETLPRLLDTGNWTARKMPGSDCSEVMDGTTLCDCQADSSRAGRSQLMNISLQHGSNVLGRPVEVWPIPLESFLAEMTRRHQPDMWF
jgi:hypothetical protein